MPRNATRPPNFSPPSALQFCISKSAPIFEMAVLLSVLSYCRVRNNSKYGFLLSYNEPSLFKDESIMCKYRRKTLFGRIIVNICLHTCVYPLMSFKMRTFGINFRTSCKNKHTIKMVINKIIGYYKSLNLYFSFC